MQMKLNNLSSHGQVTLTEESIHLVVDPASTLSLFNFLNRGNVSLPITLQQVSYYFDSSVLTVDTRGYGSQMIIPNVVQLRNTHLSFSVNLQNISTLVVTFTGDWAIDRTTIAIQAVYHHQSGVVDFEADLSSFTLNLQRLANDVVGISLPSSVSGTLSISELSILGKVTASSDIRLYIIARISSTKVFIIYQKDANQAAKKAVAVEILNIRFGSLLQDTTGLDITEIPYFGSVSVNIGLTIATTRITDLPDNFFATCSLLNKTGNRIDTNVTAIISFGFSPVAIKMCYCGGFPSFQPIIPGGISVNNLLSAIPNINVGTILLPPGISGFPQLRIDSFVLDLQLRKISVNIDYPNSLNFFDGLLRLDDLLPVLNISTLGVQLAFLGELSISGIDFSTIISLDAALNKYLLTARVDILPITSLITQLQLELLPPELNSLLHGLPFFSFSINDASLSYSLSPTSRQIQIAGTPVISGYNTVHMAAVILRQGRRTLLVQGFELGSVNLARFLRSITGSNFNNIALLNQDMEVALLVSPVTLPSVQLNGNKLSEFSIMRGVSVQATMQFPSDCSSDTFCAVARSLLGSDAQMNVQGTIASTTSFSLFAGVFDLNLGGGIVMSQAGVEIQVGTLNRIGIVGAVDLSNPDITLAARVFLSTSGVVLEMTMRGCWENAFGANWLDICNLQSSVAMIPGATLTGLALGGEIRIGGDTCGTPLVGTGFVGIDAVLPTQNYYYANLSRPATVSTILNALCVNISVPAPLAQSGFPRGFMSSFSLAGVELPHVPLSIPLGYRLSGTLNFLGLEASADVIIGLPNGIDITVALPPIQVGGHLLQMFASSSDHSHGPNLTANIDLLPVPGVDVQATGYLSVLGISVDATLMITNSQYMFDIQGNMLGLFAASLHIAEPYGNGNIQDANFRVRGSFTNNLYSVLENEVRSGLEQASVVASQARDAAQAGLNSARDALNIANSALERGQNEVRRAQAAFDDAVNGVANQRNRLNSVCSIRRCGSGKCTLDC